MDANTFALVAFVLITTFTPGPNNISSASMGILYGYKRSLGYLSGIVIGFSLVMLLCGWISSTIILVFPAFEKILRIVGSVYILWLAFHTLKASYMFKEDQQIYLGFSKGFFLQLLNPKVIVYGLTLYSTFLSKIVANPVYLFVSAFALAGTAFCTISTWTLFGAMIRAYLNRPRLNKAINISLSLLLVYTAVELSGLLDFLFP